MLLCFQDVVHESNGAGPSRLDAQLQAYHAKALRAQTRLSETLDMIDEMERTHAEQLALNERREGKLKQKMRAYADVAKKAEEETEDMRQAVLKLIDKGACRGPLIAVPYRIDDLRSGEE